MGDPTTVHVTIPHVLWCGYPKANFFREMLLYGQLNSMDRKTQDQEAGPTFAPALIGLVLGVATLSIALAKPGYTGMCK